MKKSCLSLTLLSVLAAAGTVFGATKDARVGYVTDGGSAVLDDGTVVRYIGVVAPFPGNEEKAAAPYGKESMLLNKRLVAGKRVRLVLDTRKRDKSEALLAYVYAGKYFINASLIQSGYAKAKITSPNTRFAALFEKLEREAREKKRGLWKLAPEKAPTFGNQDLKKLDKKGGTLTNKDLRSYQEENEGD